MRHKEWFSRLTDGTSGSQAAEKAGISTTTLNYQLRRNRLAAEHVIALCRAYGESPISGLLATGHLTEDEVRLPPARESAKLLSSQELVHELAMRIDEDEEAWEGTFGEVVEDAAVISFPAEDQDEEPALEGLPWVADDSPDEPLEGDEGFGEGP